LFFRFNYVEGSGVFENEEEEEYIKTFTGSWDFLTGIAPGALISMKRPGNYNEISISGKAIFPPNSFVNFQLVHYTSGLNDDVGQLVISGSEVLNPINQTITQTNA